MKREKNLFFDILNTVTKCFLVFIGVLIVYLMCSGIRVINSGNVAVVLRFGKVVGKTKEEQVKQPGLLFAFPSFIDEVVVIPANNVMEQTINTHYTDRTGITGLDGGYLLTGDQGVIVSSASVKYVVSDPVNYALHVSDIDSVVDSVVSSAMINVAAHIKADDLLTSKKAEFRDNVQSFAEEKLDKLNVGIDITSLELTQVTMPIEVLDWYNRVQSATIQAKTMKEQAESEFIKSVAKAQQEVDTMIANAREYLDKTTSEAASEMSEINGVADELKAQFDAIDSDTALTDEEKEKAKNDIYESTKTRIYAEKIKEILTKIEKVVIVDGDSEVIIRP